MKKLSILIVFLFCAVISFCQLTPVPRGNANQIDQFRGVIQGSKGIMIIPNDTTNNPTTPFFGALTVLPTDAGLADIPIWMSNGLYWIRFTGGSASNINDTIWTRIPIRVDSITVPGRRILFLLHADGIESPGYVIWTGTGLIFNVTPSVYDIGFRQFNSPFSTVTLAPASAFVRKDLFIVDTLAQASALTGAAGGATPQTNPSSQLPLTDVTISPGDTIPAGIQLITIYNENLGNPNEFQTSSLGTITVDFNNTDNPYIGAKAAFISTYQNGSQLIFTHTGTPDTMQVGDILRGFIWLNVPLTGRALQFQWFNGATPISNSIAVSSGYGINPLNTGQWQIFAIPKNVFNFPGGNAYTKLVITMAGVDTSGAGGFYIDYLQLQSGLNNFTDGKGVLNYSKNAGNDSTILLLQDGTRFAASDEGGSGSAIPPNIGAGFRIYAPQTPGFKTLFNGYAIGIDSSSNTNGLTFKADTSLLQKFILANNGLNKTTNNIIKLGGTLLTPTVIFTNGNYLQIAGSQAGAGLSVTNVTGTGAELNGTTNGFQAQTTTNGFYGGLIANVNNTNLSGISGILELERISSVNPSTGYGGEVDFLMSVGTGGGNDTSNSIISKWTNVTNGAYTSEFSITGVNSTVASTLFTLSGSGATKLNKYGIGTFTGTKTYDLGVDANGNIIESTGAITIFRWSVLDSLNTPVVTPAQGNPYLVGTVPTGAFVGHANEIAIYDTTSGYFFNTATIGDLLYNATTQEVSQWTGTDWVRVTVNNYVHIMGEETIIGKKSFADTLNLLAKPIQIITTPNIPVSLLTTRAANVSFPWLQILGDQFGSKIIMGQNNDGSASDELRIVADYTDSIWTGVYRPLVVDVHQNLKFNVSRAGDLDSVVTFQTFNCCVVNDYLMVMHNSGQITFSQYADSAFSGTPIACAAFDANGNVIKVACGSGGGGTNLNIGSGFRLAVPNTNNIKTLFNKYGLIFDSSSNVNGISGTVDTSFILTKLGAASLYEPINTRWGLTGNAGTNITTNFMGSTDDVAVRFRQNNVFRMQLDTNGRSNLFIGNRPGIVWTGKVNLLIWDTSRIDPAFNGQTGGIEVVKEVYKISGDATLDGYINGIASETRIGGANTANWTDALQGQVSFYASNNIQVGATGTITRMVEYLAGADVGGMATSNRYGLLVNNPSLHDGATMTRNYPIYIANQTSAAVINYGIYSATDNNIIAPASNLRASAGGLAVNALQVIATQPASPGGGSQYGVDFSITSNGSASEFNGGLRVNYLSGYTGSSLTLGVYGANAAAGTGTSITGTGHNTGGFFQNTSTTTGTNIGSTNWASNGNINIALEGQAITAKASSKNIGLYVMAHNTHITAPIEIGAYISLDSSDIASATATSGVLILNNSTETSKFITQWKVNNVEKARVDSAGSFLLNTTTTDATSVLQMNGNINMNTAGNKLFIATGTNASIGVATLVGGTITVSTTAVTASSKIFLTDATTGALTNIGTPTVGTIVAGTSFVINSSNILDTSAVNWIIVN